MSDHRVSNTTGESTQGDPGLPPVPVGTEPVWSGGVLDPGDSHDKGELSLCVGEAA